MKDLVIIGSGPAGMTAALYAARKKMDFSILSKEFGGHMALSSEIDNYPAFRNVSGYDLAVNFREHLKGYGVKIDDLEIQSIEKKKDFFVLKSKDKAIETKALIIATGRKPKELEAKNAEKFKAKGISYCATCDAPLYADKTVAVIGGGNSAMDAAMQASKYAKKVYVLVRKDQARADSYIVEKVSSLKNAEIWYICQVEEFRGKNFLEEIVVNREGKKITLKVEGVFSEIGWEANASFIDFVKKNSWGEIEVDNSCKTSVEGIFAAGDITSVPAKQVIISAGQGATALLSAYHWLNKK